MTTFVAGQRLTAAALNAAFNGAPQLISTVTLASAQATIPFAVPAGLYNRLTLYWRAQLSTTGSADITMQIDGNTASNYLWVKNESHSSAVSYLDSPSLTTLIKIGVVSGTTTSYFGNGCQNVEGWSNTTGYLTCTGTYGNFSVAGSDWSGVASGLFQLPGPHSSLSVSVSTASFSAGSTFSLYGLT